MNIRLTICVVFSLAFLASCAGEHSGNSSYYSGQQTKIKRETIVLDSPQGKKSCDCSCKFVNTSATPAAPLPPARDNDSVYVNPQQQLYPEGEAPSQYYRVPDPDYNARAPGTTRNIQGASGPDNDQDYYYYWAY